MTESKKHQLLTCKENSRSKVDFGRSLPRYVVVMSSTGYAM